VSKGIPSSVTTANNNSSPQSPSTFLVSHNRALSESLEKLAQQIQTPLSYPHPIPPPRRSSSESMERSAGAMGQSASSSSPPRLPPKNAKLPAAKPPTPTATPKQQQPQISTQKYKIITQSCHKIWQFFLNPTWPWLLSFLPTF
jgi:hypothetical protein